MSKTFIIAEAGVNHNGCIKRALKMIDVASDLGVDAIKFQSFLADEMVTKNVEKANYQTEGTGLKENQYQMIKSLELSLSMHEKLIKRCELKKIKFLSTPFDEKSLEILIKNFGLKTIKISSGDITNAPFLIKVGRLAEEIILSTGMSQIKDVRNALGAIAFGILNKNKEPENMKQIVKTFNQLKSQNFLKERIKLLHCTSEYPAPYKDINLRAITTLKKKFNLQVGYSDHTLGIHIAIAAVAMGATVIEKHFTLDRKLKGPDHNSSIEPKELEFLVKNIRETEISLGSSKKFITSSEIKNVNIVRKFVVASKTINIGEIFSEENLKVKRSGKGLSPFLYWKIIGKKSKNNYKKDDIISEIKLRKD